MIARSGGGRLGALGFACAFGIVCALAPAGAFGRDADAQAPTPPPPSLQVQGAVVPKTILRIRTVPDRSADAMSSFAAAMDEAIARAGLSGLIPHSPALGFRLEGYGTVFISAVVAPWGWGDRPAGSGPNQGAPGPGTSAPDAPDSRLANARSGEAEAALARAEIDRLTKRLSEIEASLGASAPAEGAGGLAQLLSLARLDASLGAIDSRLKELEARTGDGSEPAPELDQVARLQQTLVDLLLSRGRTVAPPEGDLSIVVIVSPLGPLSALPPLAHRADGTPLTLQVSVRASELASEADLESVRRRIRVVRSGS